MTTPDRPDEFSLIARYFAPLAASNPGALGLSDDAGLIDPPQGHQIVATTDTLVAGVHFRPGDPPGLVARKLLRVNLSDLAAMGARPLTYLVATSLPSDIGTAWIAGFADGLAADQAEFAIVLLGGDTTATPGPLSLTLTALGTVPAGGAVTRGGARPGDDIYVSGTIGDAALGLRVLAGELDCPADAAAFLADRYLLPQPRIGLGQALRGLASAAADISDGLVADLGHICAASGGGARVEAELVPLSPSARALAAGDPRFLEAILAGGDDYELVFTAPPARAGAVMSAAAGAGIPVARIGGVTGEGGISVVDGAGTPVSLDGPGYRHF